MTDAEQQHVVETDRFSVVFTVPHGQDVATVDNAAAVITLPDGPRSSGTFMTLDAIARTMERQRTTGGRLGGRYFQEHDLVIVRQPGVDAMVEVVRRHLDSDDEFIDSTFQTLPEGKAG